MNNFVLENVYSKDWCYLKKLFNLVEESNQAPNNLKISFISLMVLEIAFCVWLKLRFHEKHDRKLQDSI